MKKRSNTLFTYLNIEQVDNLTLIVKETLAKNVSTMPNTFNAADLWNIQRQKKGFVQRRYIL
jgi:hypothetical protein